MPSTAIESVSSLYRWRSLPLCRYVPVQQTTYRIGNHVLCTVDVPIYRPVVARPKRTDKQGKPVNRYTGENARTCTRRADVSQQTSIWRVCVSPAVVVACSYSSIISARVCNTAVHRRQQFSYDSSALSAQAGDPAVESARNFYPRHLLIQKLKNLSLLPQIEPLAGLAFSFFRGALL